MKQYRLSMSLLFLVCLLSGCRMGATPTSTGDLAVEDQASLLTSLQAAGAAVEVSDPIKQVFFTPKGTVIKVNGQDVQVFEYKNKEAMEAEAAQVKADGGTIGTEMVMWPDVPHFYKAGRVLVVYVGSYATILNLLENTIGTQFAGK